MPTKFFEPTKFSAESLDLIATINDILEDYAAQGYDLSVRQLYYQLVTQNRIANSEASYKQIVNLVTNGRLAGYIDWDMIVDRGRTCIQNSHWNSIQQILNSCAQQFRYNTWDDQPWHVEVMVEKLALEGVLDPVCRRLDIPFTSNKGYSSTSALYEAGKRIKAKMDEGKHICVIYLGDHDPSGLDMTRDVEERLKIFAGYRMWTYKDINDAQLREKANATLDPRYFARYKVKEYSHLEFKIDRIALNMDQIQEYNPPPNPAKITDTRAKTYTDQFGLVSWELDALAPSVLAGLVEANVDRYKDQELYEAALERQAAARSTLEKIAKDAGSTNL